MSPFNQRPFNTGPFNQPQGAGAVLDPPVTGVLILTIDGIEREALINSFSIRRVTNGLDMLTAEIGIDEDSLLDPPVEDQAVEVSLDGTPIFGGYVTQSRRKGWGGPNLNQILIEITASDYGLIAQYRHLNTTIPVGTLKASLTAIVAVLAPYGVTLDAAQVDGPTLPEVIYSYRRIDVALNDLATISGYTWKMGADLSLRMVLPGTLTAPVNLTETPTGDEIGDIEVESSRNEGFADCVIVLIGTGTQVSEYTVIANGSDISWTTPFPAEVAGFWPGYVIVDTIYTPTGSYEPGDPSSLSALQWDPVTHTLYQRSGDAPLANGTVLILTYTAQFPAPVIRGSAASTRREVVVLAPDAFTVAAGEAIGDGELAKRTPNLVTIRFARLDHGWLPGQTFTMVESLRDLNGTFLITEVTLRRLSNSESLIYQIAAIGSSVFQGTWRDVYHAWGTAGQGSTGVSVIGAAPSGGGGGSSVSGAAAYDVAGAGGEFVQSAGPDWVALTPKEFEIDTAVRGLAMTFKGRLKATAGTVTARWRNLTDGVTSGSSSAQSSPDWENVTFPITLTAGLRRYRLELLPSLADTDVSAVGVTE